MQVRDIASAMEKQALEDADRVSVDPLVLRRLEAIEARVDYLIALVERSSRNV